MIQQEFFMSKEKNNNIIGVISDSHDRIDTIKRAVEVFKWYF